MKKNTLIIVFAAAILAACNSNSSKPKPLSDSISKTAVAVNGKKDSVINNPDKNYGNATIAEPCVKCVIATIKADENFKKAVVSEKDIKFVINYVKTLHTGNSDVNEAKATNALRIDVLDKMPSQRRISSYIYDNSESKLYVLNKNTARELHPDTVLLKKIRNTCYWGVVSGK